MIRGETFAEVGLEDRIRCRSCLLAEDSRSLKEDLFSSVAAHQPAKALCYLGAFRSWEDDLQVHRKEGLLEAEGPALMTCGAEAVVVVEGSALLRETEDSVVRVVFG
jgi:hypothetical protein